MDGPHASAAAHPRPGRCLQPKHSNLAPGSRVVIVDDVFTQGNSAAKAVDAVRSINCEVVAVLALVDRLQGARKRFSQLGVMNYQSVFTVRDFGVDVDERDTAQDAAH